MIEFAALLPTLKRIFWIVAISYSLVCLLAFLFQRRLMYVPATDVPVRPAHAKGLVDVPLEAQDGTALRAWYWPGERAATVVLFHGNAGHRGHRLDWMQRIHALGYGAFVLDYRGYGGSAGSPSEAGFYLDGDAALRWVADHAKGPLVIAGSSIGGGVAVEMAVRHPPQGLLLTNSAPSTTEIAKHAYPFLPVSLLIKDRFENGRKIANVTCPVLVLHAEDDQIAPIALGRALFARANDPKQFKSFVGVGHNDIWRATDDAYWRTVAAFLARVTES